MAAIYDQPARSCGRVSPRPGRPLTVRRKAFATQIRSAELATCREISPICADIGFAAVGIRVAQIWVFGSRHGQTRRVLGAVGSSGQSVGRGAWFASRVTAQASATGPTCPSLSGLLTERIV
jgi:hypothetical protein